MTTPASTESAITDAPTGEDSTTPTVRVPAHMWDKAQAIVDKANRRLQRAGSTEMFELVVAGHEYVEKLDEDDNPITVDMLVAHLNSPRITVDDWEFIAKAEVDDASGAVLVHTNPSAPDTDNLPILQATDLRCDHCQASRRRTRVYIIRRQSTGEYMTVGAQCIAPFLGLSPTALWWLDEQLRFDELDTPATRRGAAVVPRDRSLALAWVASNEGRAYVPAQSEGPSTRDIVMSVYFPPPPRQRVNWKEVERRERVSAQAETVSPDVIAAIVDAASTLDPDSSYGHNLQAIVAHEMVSVRNLGYLVSLASVYRRNLDNTARREARERDRAERRAATASGLFAPEKARITDVSATVEVSHILTSDLYDDRALIVFRTDDGHLLKWASASDAAFELEVGDRTIINRATVKGLEPFNGLDQTVILRPKITITEHANQDGHSE